MAGLRRAAFSRGEGNGSESLAQGPDQQRSWRARERHRIGVWTAALAGVLWLLAFPGALSAQAQLQPATIREFDIYAQAAEMQFSQRLAGESPFLWSSEEPGRAQAVSEGEIVVEPSSGQGWHEIQGGLLHDWSAAALVPGVRVEQVVNVVTSYDTHATTYAPSVIRSRILERDGRTYRVAMRMLAKNVLTAVLDTEHRAEYAPIDELRWWGRSHSVSIREVRRPGRPDESLKPAGNDNGYLWRLRVFWRFEQTGTGVIAEHRAISLTRSIPRALRWMLRPILVALPRRSLDEMMRKTRESALANAREADTRAGLRRAANLHTRRRVRLEPKLAVLTSGVRPVRIERGSPPCVNPRGAVAHHPQRL